MNKSIEQVSRHAEAAQGTAIAYYIPDPLDDQLDAAIEELERDLVPAGREAAYRGIVFALRVLSASPPANDVLSGYAAILGELPPDLLMKALRGALGATTWHKLPPPGSFMMVVKDELAERTGKLGLLKRHRGRVQLVSRTLPHRASKLEAVTFRPPPLRLRRMSGE